MKTLVRKGAWDHDAGMVEKTLHRVALGLGSNLGDRIAYMRAACAALKPYVEIEAVSSVYETSPAYVLDQPAFLNAALVGTTALEPMPLLYTLKSIERDLGRMPTFHYGPRVIDLDVLFYDDLIFGNVELVIPHPRLQDRAFVLRPLAEIAPDWEHPTLKKDVASMLKELLSFESVQVFGEKI